MNNVERQVKRQLHSDPKRFLLHVVSACAPPESFSGYVKNDDRASAGLVAAKKRHD